MPLRAIGDERLTDRDFRILATIAAFDRMSSVRGSGQGAWASHEKMAAWVGAEYSRFSVSVNKLVGLGYLQRDRLETDRRRQVYRVIYTDDDCLPPSKVSGSTMVCATANDPPATVCPEANDPSEIVCIASPRNGQKQVKTHSQYISLSEGINSAEAEKIDSAEAARLGARDEAIRINETLGVEANLAVLNRALRSEASVDTVGWYALLVVLIEGGPPGTHNQAFRLSETLAEVMTGEELELAKAKARKALSRHGEARPNPTANVVPFPKASEN